MKEKSTSQGAPLLIVGRDALARLLLAHFLEDLGHPIEFALDTMEMLDKVGQALPALIFDQLMEEELTSVGEVLQRVSLALPVVRFNEDMRRRASTPSAPVVLELPWPASKRLISAAVARLLEEPQESSPSGPRDELPSLRDSADTLEAMRTASEQIGRYPIEEQIGRGSMGDVYRCRDLTFRRNVAVKTIRHELKNIDGGVAVAVERFRVEAAVLSRLVHPHIVEIYDFGVDDHRGEMFLVMRHVVGQSLTRRLAQSALSLSEAVEIGFAMADALAHAHRQGVIHRDVKPGNILLDEQGVPLLTDFGLARLGHFSVSNFQTVLGTINFLAPEQVLRPRDVDARTDQYGLGATIHDCLTRWSKPPEKVDAAAVLDSLRERRPTLSELGVEVPRSLDRLLQKMLEPEAKDRYPDDLTLLEAIRAVGLSLGLSLERAL